jgi:hypothetical protein
MDNFDLKKYLVENKVTKSSQSNESYVSSETTKTFEELGIFTWDDVTSFMENEPLIKKHLPNKILNVGLRTSSKHFTIKKITEKALIVEYGYTQSTNSKYSQTGVIPKSVMTINPTMSKIVYMNDVYSNARIFVEIQDWFKKKNYAMFH